MRRDQQLRDNEVELNEGEEIVSTTDTRGVITYVNDAFIRVSGFSRDELIKKNHNIVRHPDMPKAAFKDMWDNIAKGQAWRGVVKNICKDGSYYWVDAFVTPIYEQGKIVGYQSVRVKPSKQQKQTAIAAYKAINAGKLGVISEIDSSKLSALAALLIIMLIIASGLTIGWLSAIPILAACCVVLGIFKAELIDTPAAAMQLKDQFDSVSRFIYSGKGTKSHFDFHLGIESSKVRTILGRVQDGGKSLNKIGDAMLDASKHSKENIEKQRFEVQQIATAINEMTSTSQEIGRNTTNTSNVVTETTSKCSAAQQRMTHNSQQIHNLATNVEGAAKSADRLVTEAENVASVMAEIEAIAEQTNLLALNAAIEAARAGEQGRGFAVVADEVRALSSRTQQSTTNIHESLSSMQKTIGEWVNVMKETQQHAEKCADDAQISASEINDIYQSMTDVNDHASQIATASEQQEAVCEEVNNNIMRISDISEETFKSAEDLASKAEALAVRIGRLESMSRTFER